MGKKTMAAQLKEVMRELGLKPEDGLSYDDLQAQIETELRWLFASKGIKAGVTVRYAANAPKTVAGKELTVVSTEINWKKACPLITLGGPGKFYTALTLVEFASVVK